LNQNNEKAINKGFGFKDNIQMMNGLRKYFEMHTYEYRIMDHLTKTFIPQFEDIQSNPQRRSAKSTKQELMSIIKYVHLCRFSPID
jgi:hypothetical protein